MSGAVENSLRGIDFHHHHQQGPEQREVRQGSLSLEAHVREGIAAVE